MGDMLIRILNADGDGHVFRPLPFPKFELDANHYLIGKYDDDNEVIYFDIVETGTKLLGRELKIENREPSNFYVYPGLSSVEGRYDSFYFHLGYESYNILFTLDWNEIGRKIREYWKEGRK